MESPKSQSSHCAARQLQGEPQKTRRNGSTPRPSAEQVSGIRGSVGNVGSNITHGTRSSQYRPPDAPALDYGTLEWVEALAQRHPEVGFTENQLKALRTVKLPKHLQYSHSGSPPPRSAAQSFPSPALYGISGYGRHGTGRQASQTSREQQMMMTVDVTGIKSAKGMKPPGTMVLDVTDLGPTPISGLPQTSFETHSCDLGKGMGHSPLQRQRQLYSRQNLKDSPHNSSYSRGSNDLPNIPGISGVNSYSSFQLSQRSSIASVTVPENRHKRVKLSTTSPPYDLQTVESAGQTASSFSVVRNDRMTIHPVAKQTLDLQNSPKFNQRGNTMIFRDCGGFEMPQDSRHPLSHSQPIDVRFADGRCSNMGASFSSPIILDSTDISSARTVTETIRGPFTALLDSAKGVISSGNSLESSFINIGNNQKPESADLEAVNGTCPGGESHSLTHVARPCGGMFPPEARVIVGKGREKEEFCLGLEFLISESLYFRKKMTRTSDGHAHLLLDGISPSIFRSVLDWMFYRRVQLRPRNGTSIASFLVKLDAVADLFQMPDLKICVAKMNEKTTRLYQAGILPNQQEQYVQVFNERSGKVSECFDPRSLTLE